MKRKKLTIVILILSLLFLFGAIGNIIIMNTGKKFSEANTTELKATVESIKLKGSMSSEYGVICTEEYGEKLSVLNMEEIADQNDFANLQPGETIYFRIENVWLEQFQKMSFVPVVSLRTEEKEIVTLHSHNSYLNRERTAAAISAVIVGILFFLIFIYCILRLTGVRGFHIGKKVG